jgi:pyrroloquinoline quinone biosynthesis protein B
MNKLICIIVSLFTLFCTAQSSYVVVLGIAQDGGYPHLGCEKDCCNSAWKNDSLKRFVTCLALIDSVSKQWWLFEATPDIKYQLNYFRELTKQRYNYLPNGIFITHAHIGHYTGLMQLGREVFNTKQLPVYVLPKLKLFLESNGPWSQLVSLKNISLIQLDTAKILNINQNISLQSFSVPHRDEYSETAGFKIITPNKKYLFIPDIDKWEKWNRSIVEEVKKVDFAFIDGTFSEGKELINRKIEEVPHPFISETLTRFKNESTPNKNKIFFIHFNHTNPALWDINFKQKTTLEGYNIATQGLKY